VIAGLATAITYFGVVTLEKSNFNGCHNFSKFKALSMRMMASNIYGKTDLNCY
jgi:hypothetical protein|tara:strand:- start:2477 stop:2635 length:159 start_codon:yes stop_codon:yes gene_type:complete